MLDPREVERNPTVIVSRDMRASSEPLAESLIEGLRESGLNVHFNDREATALQHAIAAMEGVADDSGYGLIGRAPEPPPPQHILERWRDD